jgi:hypothetical protein
VQPTFVHNRHSALEPAATFLSLTNPPFLTLHHTTDLPIMPYGKVDELAINTIRTLAVCLSCPTNLANSYPAIAIFFSTPRGVAITR